MFRVQSQMQRGMEMLFCWALQGGAIEGIGQQCNRGSNALLKYMFFKLTRPFRRWIDPPSAHMIPIHLMLFTQSRTRASLHSPVDIGEAKLFGERRFMVPVSDAIAERDVYTEIIAGYLSTLIVVPENQQVDIMKTIFDAIKRAEPGCPIDVVMLAVNVNILGTNSVVPTTKSMWFKRLDNVKLDSTIRQKPCGLCGNSLDQCYEGEGIKRLPCSHLFHVGCFVQCIELTPVFFCPDPYCDLLYFAGTPTKTSQPLALPLPLALMVLSAGYLLTGVLIRKLMIHCGLLKKP